MDEWLGYLLLVSVLREASSPERAGDRVLPILRTPQRRSTGLLESERLLDIDARVARTLAALFHPVLQPGIESRIAISQEEIGYLAGVSRQRVNKALRQLEDDGFLTTQYGGITVLDLEGLRRFGG